MVKPDDATQEATAAVLEAPTPTAQVHEPLPKPPHTLGAARHMEVPVAPTEVVSMAASDASPKAEMTTSGDEIFDSEGPMVEADGANEELASVESLEIKFECPICGQHISATSEQIGATDRCPSCGRSVTVPSQRSEATQPDAAITSEPVVQAEIPPPPPPPQTSEQHPPPPPPPISTFALWNPVAVAAWSLLGSPILGALIHARNWKVLGNSERARRNYFWAVIFGVVLLSTEFILLVHRYRYELRSRIICNLFNGLSVHLDRVGIFVNVLWFAGLAIWFIVEGRAQIAAIKSRWGDEYPRASLVKPLLCSLPVAFVYTAMISEQTQPYDDMNDYFQPEASF